MTQLDGGVVDGLFGGLGPEVQGVAGTAAFEALESLLFQIG